MAARLASRREKKKNSQDTCGYSPSLIPSMGFTPGILRDKTMDNTLKYIQMYDRQNYNSVVNGGKVKTMKVCLIL